MKPSTIIAVVIILLLGSDAPAKDYARIVSLKPNITTILFELGLDDRLVGVTTFCDRPEGAKKIPKVADYTKPFLEKLIAQNPDLVIASKEQSSKRTVENIERLGIDILVVDFTTSDEMKISIMKIAKKIGNKVAGEVLIKRFDERKNELIDRYKGKKRLNALILWGTRPFVVAGRDSAISEFLGWIGIENVAKSSNISFPHWGLEEIIRANPDIIFDFSQGMEMKKGYDWTNLKNLSAVKGSKIFALNPSEFRTTPEIIDSLKKLSARIYDETAR